jgi:hypothetical protein
MQHSNRWISVILIIAGLLISACAESLADAAEQPVHVEPIAGQEDLSRVMLTARATERLGLQTTSVIEEEVVRIRRVGGEVVDITAELAATGAAVSGSLTKTWVRVSLTESVLNQVDPGQSVLVLPLPGDAEAAGVTAQPAEAPAGVDAEAAVGVLYYMVDGAEHGLVPGQVVFVELTLLGGGMKKIIPYASVIYDLHGETWTYTNPEPLVYIRQPITVDYIEGDLAILLEGPPVDTEVVTVGVAELFGAESGVGGGGHK